MAATETAGRWRRGRLGREARASLAAFLLGASVAALPLALGSPSALLAAPGLRGRLALALHVAVVNAVLLLLYPRPLYKVRGGAGRCGAVRAGGRRVGPRGRQQRAPCPLLADRHPGRLPGLRLRLRAVAERRPLRLAALRLVRAGGDFGGGQRPEGGTGRGGGGVTGPGGRHRERRGQRAPGPRCERPPGPAVPLPAGTCVRCRCSTTPSTW